MTVSGDDTQQTQAMAPGGPGGPRKRPWVPFAVAGGALVVVAVALVLIFTVFASSGDDTASGTDAYKAKVQEVLAPVVAANERLSRSLGALHGTNPAAARRAAQAAQDATLTARGALNALTVPEGGDQVAVNARGTLSREAAYLDAVSAALEDPSSETVSQTTTLAANLTDALNVIAPGDQDWAQSVDNADTLVAWAPDAVAAIKRNERREKARDAKRRSPRSGSGGGGGAAPSVPTGTDCGDGLRAGPNTSCPFARNVREAYYEAPGTAATVRVYSPVTGMTYTMSCSPAGAGVTCSGGNNASVSWD